MAQHIVDADLQNDCAKRVLPRQQHVALLTSHWRRSSLLLLALLALTSCGQWVPRPDVEASKTNIGAKLATVAQRELGIPYRYGGASPSGFDCSGLVFYVHQQLGIAVPRTVSDQFRRARSISFAQLQPGDLLFFHLTSRGISHVGIYTGGRRFVHAPQGGKDVSIGSLESDFWRKRLMAAGRYY